MLRNLSEHWGVLYPNTKKDGIYIVDKDKNRIDGKSVEYKYGTVSHNTQTANVEGKDTKLDIFNIKGDDNAKEAFELFANNTNVEWTHAKIGKTEGENGNNAVGTSHSEKSTPVLSYLRDVKKYFIRESNHNHPNDNPNPSGKYDKNWNLIGGDLYNRELSIKANPQVKLNIYTRTHGYTPYTRLKDFINFRPPTVR